MGGKHTWMKVDAMIGEVAVAVVVVEETRVRITITIINVHRLNLCRIPDSDLLSVIGGGGKNKRGGYDRHRQQLKFVKVSSHLSRVVLSF